MRTRIISAIIGIAIGIVGLMLLNTLWFNLIIAAIAVIAVYELLLATKYLNNKPLTLASLSFVFVVPFFEIGWIADYKSFIVTGFIFILFALMLAMHNTLRIEQVGLVFMVSTLIPFSFSTILYIRDDNPNHALFYVVLTLLGAWAGDTGAYFIGSFFGKHKLAPDVSPKKTVEGLIGGIITAALAFALAGFGYTLINPDISVNYLLLALIGVLCTVVGTMGDLSASMIKRQCAIKDFGTIMPGHGGILDRFDSVLFVAPVMMQAIKLFNIVV